MQAEETILGPLVDLGWLAFAACKLTKPKSKFLTPKIFGDHSRTY